MLWSFEYRLRYSLSGNGVQVVGSRSLIARLRRAWIWTSRMYSACVIPLADDTPRQHAPFVLWTLAAINVAAFLFEMSLPEEELHALLYRWGVVPARDGAILERPGLGLALPFFSSMFLHGGWMHLLGNMWMLWIFGDNVEDRMGAWRFTAFYLLTGLAAGAAHVVSDPGSEVPTIGASGAVAGVLGAYALLYPKGRVLVLLPIVFYPLLFRVPALLFAGIWFGTQVFSGAMNSGLSEEGGGVAWWAHIGGVVAGAALCMLFLHPGRRRRRVYLDESAGHDRLWMQLVPGDGAQPPAE